MLITHLTQQRAAVQRATCKLQTWHNFIPTSHSCRSSAIAMAEHEMEMDEGDDLYEPEEPKVLPDDNKQPPQSKSDELEEGEEEDEGGAMDEDDDDSVSLRRNGSKQDFVQPLTYLRILISSLSARMAPRLRLRRMPLASPRRDIVAVLTSSSPDKQSTATSETYRSALLPRTHLQSLRRPRRMRAREQLLMSRHPVQIAPLLQHPNLQ